MTTVAKRPAINLKKRLARNALVSDHVDVRDPRDAVDELAMRILVEERLKKLSPRQRQAIRERYLLDKDVAADIPDLRWGGGIHLSINPIDTPPAEQLSFVVTIRRGDGERV